MSDIRGPLQAAAAVALRGDAGVMLAFGANPIQIFDLVPVDAVEPYLSLGPASVLPLQAEGFALSEIDFPVHVWSRPDPPGRGEAQAIAAAVAAVMPTVQVAWGGRVYYALPVRTEEAGDPSDPRVVHATVTTRFTTAPA